MSLWEGQKTMKQLRATAVLRRLAGRSGQAASEYMMVVSVLVIAVVAVAYTFVPSFHHGVNDLASSVRVRLEKHGQSSMAADQTTGQGGNQAAQPARDTPPGWP
jgi:hypothetical protein